MADSTPIQKVDILPPSWRGIVPIIAAVLQDGTDKGKKEIMPELNRMADLADQRNQWNDLYAAALEGMAALEAADAKNTTAYSLLWNAIEKAKGDK